MKRKVKRRRQSTKHFDGSNLIWNPVLYGDHPRKKKCYTFSGIQKFTILYTESYACDVLSLMKFITCVQNSAPLLYFIHIKVHSPKYTHRLYSFLWKWLEFSLVASLLFALAFFYHFNLINMAYRLLYTCRSHVQFRLSSFSFSSSSSSLLTLTLSLSSTTSTTNTATVTLVLPLLFVTVRLSFRNFLKSHVICVLELLTQQNNQMEKQININYGLRITTILCQWVCVCVHSLLNKINWNIHIVR